MIKAIKTHYAWMICVAGTLMLFCSIGLAANVFSVYQPFIINVHGFSNTQGSMLVTLRMVSAFLSLMFIDKYYQILNVRLGATLAIVSIGVAYLVFSVADRYWTYAIAAFISGIGYSIGAMIPVSIIVSRWFHSHKALALGICSAGTGMSTVIMPPLLTAIIESLGLHTAFLLEAVLILVIAALIFILLRNSPEEMGLEPLTDAKDTGTKTGVQEGCTLGKKEKAIAIAIMFLLGGSGSNGFTHLGVLYTTENYDSMEVAAIISAAGILLMIGKCVYGGVNDRIGAYRANYLFVTLLIAGLACCCLAPLHNRVILLIGIFALGFGFPVNNVGLPIWAEDLSNADTHEKVLKNFQMAYSCGTMVCSLFIGVSADIFKSYVPIYMVFTTMSVIFLVFLQKIYRTAGVGQCPCDKGNNSDIIIDKMKSEAE